MTYDDENEMTGEILEIPEDEFGEPEEEEEGGETF